MDLHPNTGRQKIYMASSGVHTVISGAIGNFIDRAFRHYVVDFIYFEPIDFPIFNVADMYVVIAAALLIFVVLFVYKEDTDFDFIQFKKRGSHE